MPPPLGTQFHVNVSAFQNLIDMGFTEDQVLASLELSHNNFEVACDLLLGGGDVIAALQKRKEHELDVDSPLLQKLLKDARVHAGLCDPKIRSALECVVNDPQTVGEAPNTTHPRTVSTFDRARED